MYDLPDVADRFWYPGGGGGVFIYIYIYITSYRTAGALTFFWHFVRMTLSAMDAPSLNKPTAFGYSLLRPTFAALMSANK